MAQRFTPWQWPILYQRNIIRYHLNSIRNKKRLTRINKMIFIIWITFLFFDHIQRVYYKKIIKWEERKEIWHLWNLFAFIVKKALVTKFFYINIKKQSTSLALDAIKNFQVLIRCCHTLKLFKIMNQFKKFQMQ
jgi:hypothetical protein